MPEQGKVRRAAAAVLFAVLVSTLAGCTASPGANPGGGPDGAPPAVGKPTGITVASCNEKKLEVTSFNPSAGSATRIASFPMPGGGATNPACKWSGTDAVLKAREQFSPDLSRLVASWTEPKGSHTTSRVGWIDQNGTRTDVTDLFAPTQADGDTSIGNPLFSPEGYLVVLDGYDQSWKWLDTAAGRIVKTQPAHTGTPFTSSEKWLLAPAYIDASGTMRSGTSESIVNKNRSAFSGTGCASTAVGWLTDTTVIAVSRDGGDIFAADSYQTEGSCGGLARNLTFWGGVMPTPGIGSAVASPDHTQIAYTAEPNGQPGISIVPAQKAADGSTQIQKKVAGLNADATAILGWYP